LDEAILQFSEAGRLAWKSVEKELKDFRAGRDLELPKW
jgi:hypothetical protein